MISVIKERNNVSLLLGAEEIPEVRAALIQIPDFVSAENTLNIYESIYRVGYKNLNQVLDNLKLFNYGREFKPVTVISDNVNTANTKVCSITKTENEYEIKCLLEKGENEDIEFINFLVFFVVDSMNMLYPIMFADMMPELLDGEKNIEIKYTINV